MTEMDMNDNKPCNYRLLMMENNFAMKGREFLIVFYVCLPFSLGSTGYFICCHLVQPPLRA